jgi:hypothetical protein
MKSEKMFGSLTKYKNQAYYEENPFMYLYTDQGNYRIDLLYGCLIGAGQWRERAFMYPENLDALLAYAAYNSTFQSNAAYAHGDSIVAMSTCSFEFDDARYVLIGVLREEYMGWPHTSTQSYIYNVPLELDTKLQNENEPDTVKRKERQESGNEKVHSGVQGNVGVGGFMWGRRAGCNRPKASGQP